MPGEAIVTIRDKQWGVNIASAPWELVQGLGGIAEIPPGTGMLCDTGWEQLITVTTESMLFPLDIAFLSESLVVVDLVQYFVPGHRITSVQPARYFLEVNAGEMDGIDLGDQVSVELLPLEEAPVIPDWMNIMFSFMGFALMGALMVGMDRPVVKGMLGQPENPGQPGSPKLKRYKGAYLTNWQYGGYSYVEADPDKPEHLWTHSMVDYADPDEVIAIAEREGLPRISLAGGFWQKIGYQGYGEKVSISEAKKALARAREHVFGSRGRSSSEEEEIKCELDKMLKAEWISYDYVVKELTKKGYPSEAIKKALDEEIVRLTRHSPPFSIEDLERMERYLGLTRELSRSMRDVIR